MPEAWGAPTQSIRVRGVIVRDGRLLMDRTHHDDRDRFYWLPGGGLEAGETSEECLRRELMEEAALEIEVGRLLYVSENLYVESGDYRHELILYRLADMGNTVLVIEHNLDVIKCADWVIDMGPEGGDGGGTVIAAGTPEQVAEAAGSHTAQYLKPKLSPAAPASKSRKRAEAVVA